MTRRTRIKICGLTREADVDAAVEAGVDAVGFVLWAGSPRAVTVERARNLVSRLGPFVSAVGLFVNATRVEVESAADRIGLTHLQFHGDEPPEFCANWNRPVIRALRVSEGGDLVSSIEASLQRAPQAAILLDSDHAGYGGSGRTFDWRAIPRGLGSRLVLSGGLTAENVSRGIADVAPFAVDVSSGVEALDEQGRRLKGLKDEAAILRFVRAVRDADRHSS